MFRENWRSLAFWRWWWRTSVSPEVKVPLALAVVAGLLVGGYVAAGHLSGASASPEASSYVVARTVQRVVTVHDQGTTRVKKVPVVVNKTVVRSRTQTAYQVQTYMSTRVVTVPGPVVVRTVPVVKREVSTVVRTVTVRPPEIIVERPVTVTVTRTVTVTTPSP